MANYTKKVKDGKNFSIYLDRLQLNHVKRIAHQMSQRENRDISASEAIRMALELAYPFEQQLDMFESNKKRLRREFQEKNQLNFTDVT